MRWYCMVLYVLRKEFVVFPEEVERLLLSDPITERDRVTRLPFVNVHEADRRHGVVKRRLPVGYSTFSTEWGV